MHDVRVLSDTMECVVWLSYCAISVPPRSLDRGLYSPRSGLRGITSRTPTRCITGAGVGTGALPPAAVGHGLLGLRSASGLDSWGLRFRDRRSLISNANVNAVNLYLQSLRSGECLYPTPNAMRHRICRESCSMYGTCRPSDLPCCVAFVTPSPRRYGTQYTTGPGGAVPGRRVGHSKCVRLQK